MGRAGQGESRDRPHFAPATRFSDAHLSSLLGVNHKWNNPIFLLTPFRLDGLAAGALLSLLLEHDRLTSTLRRWSAPVCVAAFGLFFGLELWLPVFRRPADSVAFNSMGYSLVVLGSFCLVSFLILKPVSLL